MGRALGLALESDVGEAAREMAAGVFEAARETVGDVGLRERAAVGAPSKQITETAADYDAVVLGSHSSSLSTSLYTGNVARGVTNRAPVPVTIVRCGQTSP